MIFQELLQLWANQEERRLSQSDPDLKEKKEDSEETWWVRELISLLEQLSLQTRI